MHGGLNIKRALIAGVVVCALFPALALADTADLQTQVAALMRQVRALQEQLRFLTSQLTLQTPVADIRPTIAPWDTFLAKDPAGPERPPEAFTLEADAFTAFDAATSTPQPTTCTTPLGTTVSDGGSILAQPDFTNGLRSASVVPPVMRCEAGQWLTCDWRGQNCVDTGGKVDIAARCPEGNQQYFSCNSAANCTDPGWLTCRIGTWSR